MTTGKRWTIGVTLGVLIGLWVRFVIDPTADQAVEWLIYATAPPSTLFALIYGTTTPWWRTMIGRALLVSSTALALLVDLSLLYQWLGPEYLGRSYVRLTVFALICLGAWMKFAALIGQKIAGREERAARRDRQDGRRARRMVRRRRQDVRLAEHDRELARDD